MTNKKYFFQTSRNIIICASAILSTTSLAGRGHRYDGTPDISPVRPPAQYAECPRRYGNFGDPMAVEICAAGAEEARHIAGRLTYNQGRLYGYLNGFARGVHNGYYAWNEDSEEIAKAASWMENTGNYENARIQGRRESSSIATSAAKTEVRNRIESIMNTNREPNSEIYMPDFSSYKGIMDGYSREGLPSKSLDKMISTEQQRLGSLPIYSRLDRQDLFHYPEATIWRLFESGSNYYTSSFWRSSNDVWGMWLNSSYRRRSHYDTLPPKTRVNPSTGQREIVDPNYYRVLFEQAFKTSYEYHKESEFSRGYYQELDSGYYDGGNIGERVGIQWAQQLGSIRGYNRKYQDVSRNSYQTNYAEFYTFTFRNELNDYLQNPKVTHELEALHGQIEDGILTPGETFSATLKLKNYGGKSLKAKLTAVGNIESTDVQEIEIPRFQSYTFETKVLGKIQNNLRPGQAISLGVAVNGIEQQTGSYVRSYAEVESSSLDASTILQGRFVLHLSLINPSTLRSPGEAVAEIKIGSLPSKKVNIGFLNAREKVQTALEFTDLDPWTLMNLTERKIQIKVSMNGQISYQSDSNFNSLMTEKNLASYFHLLANGKTYLPEGVDPATRLAEVSRVIIDIASGEATKSAQYEQNFWKPTQQDDTMVGQLALSYISSESSAIAKDNYKKLGEVLDRMREKIPRFYREDYRRVIEVFAGPMQGKAKKV